MPACVMVIVMVTHACQIPNLFNHRWTVASHTEPIPLPMLACVNMTLDLSFPSSTWSFSAYSAAVPLEADMVCHAGDAADQTPHDGICS